MSMRGELRWLIWSTAIGAIGGWLALLLVAHVNPGNIPESRTLYFLFGAEAGAIAGMYVMCRAVMNYLARMSSNL